MVRRLPGAACFRVHEIEIVADDRPYTARTWLNRRTQTEASAITKEQIKLEAKRILDSLDVKLEEITDDIAQEIVDRKESMDTETRRQFRAFWVIVAAVGGVACLGLGSML